MTKVTPTPKSSANGVRWNLKDLFKSPKDPMLDRDFQSALKRATAFEKKNKGAFSRKPGVSAKVLAEMVDELEQIVMLRDKPSIYASLLFAEDTQNPAYGKFMQKTQDQATQVQKHLIFWELEWCALDEKIAAPLIKDKACDRYRHFLGAVRRYKPHLLSEPEEKIVDELENTGSRAFSRLFDEMIGGMQFPVKIDGKTKELSEQEALALLYSPDRDQRKSAAVGLTSGFQQHLKPLSFVFNTLVQHHATIDRLRHYKEPMDSRHLSNEIKSKTVDALLAACDAHNGLVKRYYKLKAKLLGVKKLYDYDRYAPISTAMPTFSWKDCRQTVHQAYADFSPQFGKIVDDFFNKNWIDAELRHGKRGGAFSAGTTPDLHPYILVNYTDKLRDAVTVAHELGHGIHQYLSGKQGYLQADTPLTTAETASVFGEFLTFHHLLNHQKDPQAKLGLLCGKIEDAFATVFRQACLTHFEQKLHRARREQGELPPEQIGKIWMEVNKAMFGDSVELTEGYSNWWCYIPHFIHSPFYCYAYSFGELLVLSLYAQYRRQGKAFVPAYTALLEAGGSKSPEELTRKMGVDINKASFWEEGMEILEEMVSEAEKLADSMKKSGPSPKKITAGKSGKSRKAKS